jgi:hypothetical protein
MMTLAVDTITTAANAAGIATVIEGSETISDRLKPELPRLEYFLLGEDLDEVRAGLITAVRDEDKETRKRKKHRWTLRVRAIIAAETESAAEDYFKTFLKNLPRHVADGDGIDVKITPHRTERRAFTRKLVDVFPKKEISVFITFIGGIYTDEEVDLIKEITITPEV